MTRARPVDPDALITHVDFLRRLAGGLLRDPAAADDVVQDTLVRAVTHPPRHEGNLRGWLATVARRFALRRLRAGSRRLRHEAAAARSDGAAGAAETVARLDIERRVVDAVTALDEPYRTTVLLRYYDDLPPREIAKRLGIPVATVKTRVRRGVERLRGMLDDGDGGRKAWTVALIALVPARRSLPLGAVAAVIGVAVVVTGGVWWAQAGGAANPAPRVARVPGNAPARGGAVPVRPPRKRMNTSVRVVGDAPLGGAHILAQGVTWAGASLESTTGSDGEAAFDVAHAARYRLRVTAPGYAPASIDAALPGRAEVRLQRGARLKIRLQGYPSAVWSAVDVSVSDGVGERVIAADRAVVDADTWGPGLVEIRVRHRGFRFVEGAQLVAMPSRGEVVVTLDGGSVKFADLSGLPPESRVRGLVRVGLHNREWRPLRLLAEGAARGVVVSPPTTPLAIDAPGSATTFLDPTRTRQPSLAPPATLVVRWAGPVKPARVLIHYGGGRRVPGGRSFPILFQRGLPRPPVGDIHVDGSWALPAVGVLAQRDAAGDRDHLVFHGLPSIAPVVVVAIDADGNMAERKVLLGAPGGRQDVTLRMTERQERTFRVRDTRGDPVDGARISVDTGAKRRALGFTGPNGTLRVRGLPTGQPLRANVTMVWSKLAELALPDDGDIEIVVPPPSMRPVTVRFLTHDGLPVHGQRLYLEVGRFPVRTAVTDREGRCRFVCPTGAPGLIHDQADRVGLGRSAGQLKPDQNTVEIRRWRSRPRSAAVHVSLRGTAVVSVSLERNEDDGPVRQSAIVDRRGVFTFRLAPGTYRVAVARSDSAEKQVSLVVRDAGVARVDVAAD